MLRPVPDRFLARWRKNHALNPMNLTLWQPILTEGDIDTIFGNVEDLLVINMQLQHDLQASFPSLSALNSSDSIFGAFIH
jgi:hypothetical protein